MTEPDEDRPGGQATPPPATSPPTPGPGAEPMGDDTFARPPAAADPPPAATPPPTPPAPPAPPAPPPPAPAPVAATPPPAPAPAPAPQPAAAAAVVEDFDDVIVPRWVGLTTAAGAGIIGTIGLQVLLAIVEGLSVKKSQRLGVADDLFHRLGYPFGSLGATTVFLVLLGVLLLALPAILGEEVTDRQYTVAGAALKTAIVLGAIVALGSILAVRGSLHEYTAKSVAVPGYIRVQFTSFLLSTMAAAGLTIWGAITALSLRDET